MKSKDKKKLNRTDIKEIINYIEGEFPVDKWIINGIHIWPIIRIRFFLYYNDLNKASLSDYVSRETFTNRIIKRLQILKGLSEFVFAYLADCKKNKRLNKADVVFLDYFGIFIKVNNYWYNKFCGPFIDYFNKRGISCFLMTAQHKYFIPRYHQSMYIQPYLEYIIKKARFILELKHSWDEKLPKFFDFLDYLESKNLSIQNITLPLMRKEIIRIRLMADFFRKLLTKIKPSFVFTVCYDNLVGFAFNLASRDIGIPSVEIQHGLQPELHLSYSSWSNVPEKGYELLPSLFWCWSDFEAKIILKWCKGVSKWHKPIIGGNLWLDQWLCSSSKFVKRYDEIVLKLKESKKNCKHILFTQNIPGVENKVLKNILCVIKNSPPSWFWWIRIHPRQLKNKPKFKKILQENKILNCNIDSATDLPLYALLRNIDIHVTYSSSTVIEAEIFGVPSVITSSQGGKSFPEQISSGWATCANTPEDIIKAIKNQLERKNIINKNQKKRHIQQNEALEYLLKLVKNKLTI